MKNLVLLFCLFCSFAAASGQSTPGLDSLTTYSKDHSVSAASDKLLKSIAANKSSSEIARNYFELAEALSQSGDLPKALVYMNKAIQLELGTPAKKNLAEYYRGLARIQEQQNKYKEASESYSKAAGYSADSLQKQLNRNDFLRLQFNSPETQLQYLNQNSVILNNSRNSSRDEKLENYTQMANANIALNQNGPALENFRSALNTVDSNSEKSVLIKSNIANLMLANNDPVSAIALQKDLVQEAQNNSSVETQVTQLRNLSTMYFRIDSTDAGLKVLQDAYRLAITKGNLEQAKASLVALAAFYEKNRQEEKAAALYHDFIAHIDNLLAKDSSLIDRKLFLVNEGKIAGLEQQQVLKDQLLLRKNKYNLVLAGSVVILAVLLLLIIKALLSIRKRNKQIALQSLRREMNPHFIFNSLNSVNQFIANNNERAANKYLSSYSGLMRNIMENSNKDYVSLSTELEQLKKYLELEKLRFPDKFEYRIEIDPALDGDTVMVPNMIIQPNLENAIWHGLRYKETSGLLILKFQKSGKRTIARIDDNGIGLAESQKIKTKNQKLHESLGLKNVQERIRLLNDIYRSDIRFELKEKSAPQTGVLVEIEW